ncbi:MAG: helix-turn-helix transcriptional regulator [Cyclobacteriaceae bacterium]
MMESVQLDFWNIIFLVAGGQGIFLAALLALSKGKNKNANITLAVFVLLFSLNTLENVAFWTRYELVEPHISGATRSFVFLFGPLLLLYAKQLVDDSFNLTARDVWHLVPFAIHILFHLNYYFLDEESKRQIIINGGDSNLWFRLVFQVGVCLHLAYYSFLLFKFVKSSQDDQHQSLITSTFYGLSIYAFIFAAYYILIYAVDFKIEYDYVLSLIGTVGIYQIGYVAFVRPELLHGFVRREPRAKKYEKSALTREEGERYQTEILRLLQKEKIHLSTDLRLSELAGRLGISTNHTSQVINEYFGKTFHELLTEYRIQEALSRLDDPDNNEKLLSIALNSGFNNRTSFNQLFKKYVGCSPGEYKEKVKV